MNARRVDIGNEDVNKDAMILNRGWRCEEFGRVKLARDSLPEWSKGVDSSSTSASCVGSNPTGVI